MDKSIRTKLIIINYLNDKMAAILDDEVLTYSSNMLIPQKENQSIEDNLKENNANYLCFINKAHDTLSQISSINIEIMNILNEDYRNQASISAHSYESGHIKHNNPF